MANQLNKTNYRFDGVEPKPTYQVAVTVTELVQFRNTLLRKSNVNVEIKWLKKRWDDISELLKIEKVSLPLSIKPNWFAMILKNKSLPKVPDERMDE